MVVSPGRESPPPCPPPTDLPPRVREVLWCFLEGDSDKQVAAGLGLTWNTVNGYAKQIYTHFGVTTRTELLAKWIRNRWQIPAPPPAG